MFEIFVAYFVHFDFRSRHASLSRFPCARDARDRLVHHQFLQCAACVGPGDDLRWVRIGSAVYLEARSRLARPTVVGAPVDVDLGNTENQDRVKNAAQVRRGDGGVRAGRPTAGTPFRRARHAPPLPAAPRFGPTPRFCGTMTRCSTQFAVAEIQKRSNTLDAMQMESVSNVRRQVVAGLNYYMDIIIRRGDVREMHHVVVYDRFGDLSLTKDDIDLDWIASHNAHHRR